MIKYIRPGLRSRPYIPTQGRDPSSRPILRGNSDGCVLLGTELTHTSLSRLSSELFGPRYKQSEVVIFGYDLKLSGITAADSARSEPSTLFGN